MEERRRGEKAGADASTAVRAARRGHGNFRATARKLSVTEDRLLRQVVHLKGDPSTIRHMKSTLVYSFRTNRHLDKFKEEGVQVFVFGKLKDDLKKFQNLIEELEPKFIVGLAETKAQSRLETIAINSFGQKGKVSKLGKYSYPIYTQPHMPFPKSKRASNSFCNWTMYKIAEMVNTKNIKFSFVHFNRNDLEKVLYFVKNT